MYYGGTTYENTQGLGVQLSNAAQRGEKVGVPRAQKITAQRPHSATRLLAVPVTKLYDRGRTVSTASLLVRRIGEVFVALNPSSAEKAGVADGERVTLSLDGAKEEVTVRIDHSLATGVALIPRSMGLPILEPTPVRIKSTRKAAR